MKRQILKFLRQRFMPHPPLRLPGNIPCTAAYNECMRQGDTELITYQKNLIKQLRIFAKEQLLIDDLWKNGYSISHVMLCGNIKS